MRRLIINGDIVTGRRVIRQGWLIIKDGKIVSIRESYLYGSSSRVINAKGKYVCPGFIDLHIHGHPEELSKQLIKSGTTSFLVNISCQDLGNIMRGMDIAKEAMGQKRSGANLLGVRLEGPYLNRKQAGAQPARYIRRPDKNEALNLIRRSRGYIKMMTIAPEMKGALSLVKALKEEGVVLSIGHSEATFNEAMNGVEAGICHATHIFNKMKGVHHREPGAAGACLVDDRVMAEVILDGIHIHPAIFKFLLYCKGIDKINLATDNVVGAPPPGARRVGKVFKLGNGTIAGSTLTMIEAVKNALYFGELSIVDAVKAASLNPAKLLKIDKRKGSIAPGKDADMVIFEKDFRVWMSIVGGEVAYRRR